MTPEEEILERAQATLLAKRAESSIALHERLQGGAGGMRRGLGTAADALNVRAPAGIVVPPRCACSARLHGHERERGTCDACARGGGWSARGELLSRIPKTHRWASLEVPLIPPEKTDLAVSEEGRGAALAWRSSDAFVFSVVGADTGSGKTTLVGAIARGWADAGLDFDWMHASELDWSRPDAEANLRRACRAKRLVLDGIGQNLGGALPDSGLAAQRAPGVIHFVTALYERRGPELVALTVDLTRAQLEASHGAGVTRRIVSRSNHVHVVKLVRQKRPDYADF